MAANAFQANQGTQTNLLTDNTGGSSGTLIPVMKLSTDAQGTFTNGGIWNGGVTGTINAGSIAIVAGTIASDTIIGGTLNNVGSVVGIGSVSGLSNLPQGSINVTAGTIATLGTMGTLGTALGVGVVTTVTNLSNGTIQNSGTVTGVGVVSVLTKGTIALGSFGGVDANAVAQTANPIGQGGTDSGGTIRTILVDSTGVQRSSGSMVMTVGTITVLPNLPQGSINVTAGTIGTVTGAGTLTNLGSITNLGQVYNAGTLQAGTLTTGSLSNVAMLNAGTISMINNGTLGTVTNVGQLYNAGTVQNQLAGTITALQNGTINNGSIVVTAGTITTGTLSPIPTIANVTYGTHGTTGVSIFGTLAGGTGSGAGTEIFCTSVSLSIPSTGGSQDVSIGWGTNGGTFQAGTGLIVRGNFPAGGGIQKTFWPPINSGTNAQLCLFQAGAGTVDVSVSYFITPSTL